MTEREMDVWDWLAKRRDEQNEFGAVFQCQEGEPYPLMAVLKSYNVPTNLIIYLCTIIKHGPKRKKLGPVFQVGDTVEARLRQRPGEKKAILSEISAEYRQRGKKLTQKTAENYHRLYLKEMTTRGWTRTEVEAIRARHRAAPAPTEAELKALEAIETRHRTTGTRPAGRRTRYPSTTLH